MKFAKTAALLLSLSIAGTALCACNQRPEPVSSDINVISSQNQNGNGTGESSIAAEIDKNAESSNFKFKYKGVDIICTSKFDETKFDANDYEMQSRASCAGVGMDDVFIFKGGSVEVWTHPVDDNSGERVVWAVQLCDDTVATVEGIYIGNTRDQVKAAYGEPVADKSTENVYTYIKGTSSLNIYFDDNNVVNEITYRSTDIA